MLWAISESTICPRRSRSPHLPAPPWKETSFSMGSSPAATRKTSMSGSACHRAVWFTEPGVVEIREEPARRPERGEIAVRSLASGISQGTELLVLRGQVPADLELDLPTLVGS